MSDNANLLLEIEGVSKTFPGVKALDEVSLKIRRGTVHALLGENGAGKSTLMKIIFGIHTKDPGGSIKFEGKPMENMNPVLARSLGISMIHQELMTIPDMTVADNIYMGRYPKSKAGLVSKKQTERETNELLQKWSIDGIRASDKMRNLSQAKRQMVEIAKAISQNIKLIIMDEPTSALSESEIQKLFHIVSSLRENGISVIYISHKMEEIFAITDEYSVFRDGRYIGSGETKDVTEQELVEMMVGRPLENLYDKKKVEPGEVVLKVEGLSSGSAFHDISFEVRRGEILGISGLVGSGRTEMVETIVGMRPATAGKIYKDGKEIHIKSVRDAIENRIALATEDRKKYGLFLGLPISFNISISWLKHLCKAGLVKTKQETTVCREYAEKLQVKTNSLKRQAGTLSGGNQQKVVLAKWMLTDADILILDEPTRGIDVGAKAEIYGLMEEMVANGKTVIMVSSEMPEILGMSDRILVMREGAMKGIYNRDEVSQAQIIGYDG